MSVTAAQGFRAAGVAAGLKTSGNPDVALVVNDGPLDAAAAVFTANRVKAAPVLWTQQVIADGRLRAVILNSGGANACTGPDGFADTHRTAEHVAAALGIGAGEVGVCSTGLIGERLPMDRLLGGADAAVAALAVRRRAGRGRGHPHHRHRRQAGRGRAPRRMGGRRNGQGRGHAGAQPGHDALR